MSTYADYDDRENDKIGLDISCNLASGHMGNMIENNTIKETVESAMAIMNSVSLKTNIKHVPGVKKANDLLRSVGFGMMGHHGFIAKNMIPFGSEQDLDLLDVFFNIVNFHSLKYSMELANGIKVNSGAGIIKLDKKSGENGSAERIERG